MLDWISLYKEIGRKVLEFEHRQPPPRLDRGPQRMNERERFVPFSMTGARKKKLSSYKEMKKVRERVGRGIPDQQAGFA